MQAEVAQAVARAGAEVTAEEQVLAEREAQAAAQVAEVERAARELEQVGAERLVVQQGHRVRLTRITTTTP